MNAKPQITVSTDTNPEHMSPTELQDAWRQYERAIDYGLATNTRALDRVQTRHAWAVAVEMQRRDDAMRAAGQQPEGLSL